jgi:hypothetical protein
MSILTLGVAGCQGCGRQLTERPDAICPEITHWRAESANMRAALQKISEIRDSIIGLQKFNWSEHAYPLVAALDAAGFTGIASERVETVTQALADEFEQIHTATSVTAPIPMRLRCERCGTLHIDEGEFATKPHHTHVCQQCGLTWRPAIGYTVGVKFLPGFKNPARSPERAQ